MTNDIGMVKDGLNQAERTGPTAKADKADPTRQVEQQPLQQDELAEELEDASRAKEFAEEVASGLNELVQNLHRELQFSVDDDSGQTIIKVIDRETDEVVRQIPSEEVLRLRKRLEEASGIIFRDSA